MLDIRAVTATEPERQARATRDDREQADQGGEPPERATGHARPPRGPARSGPSAGAWARAAIAASGERPGPHYVVSRSETHVGVGPGVHGPGDPRPSRTAAQMKDRGFRKEPLALMLLVTRSREGSLAIVLLVAVVAACSAGTPSALPTPPI